jgi:diguanylate cyclase (GGDEF)-like protein
MTFIEPVSSLSIKRAVNLYTIALFLFFGILLYWSAVDRYQAYISYHENIANNTTKMVAFDINKTLKEKQRVLDTFIETHKTLITDLADNPEDEGLQHTLQSRLKRYLPDFIGFNIMTASGKPIIDAFDNITGDLCLSDLKLYLKSGKLNIRLHPDNNESHYDIVSRISNRKNSRFLFVSFEVNEFADLLSSIQPEKHNLAIINKEENNLIEIPPDGDRRADSNRLNFRLDGKENIRVLSATKIKGTYWHVIDMHDDGLFDSYRESIFKEYLIAYYIFSIIILFMRSILLSQDHKRTLAEEQLKRNHTEIKELNHRLEILSKTDSLTGLYNRRHFDKIINQEWNRGLRSHSPISCILIDIDYFKKYNDYYGHLAGDKCLVDISLVMKDAFRRAGDLIARYGGEEFIILMPATSAEDAETAITLFQNELAKLKIPHMDSPINSFVTASAGIVNQVPRRDDSIDDFIGKADEALYKAKANGRNQWQVYGLKLEDSDNL